jgi:hypothetical protein
MQPQVRATRGDEAGVGQILAVFIGYVTLGCIIRTSRHDQSRGLAESLASGRPIQHVYSMRLN